MFLERIRSGDEEAYRLFLEETWAPLVRYLLTYSESMDAAEDAAQESFVRVWEHRERWQEGSARALVFRIARNMALDGKRKADVRRRWKSSEPEPPCGDPESDARRSELAERLTEALQSLPERRREVFELVRFQGFSHEEVSGALEISKQTVANHLSAALKDLRVLLAGFLSDAQPDVGVRGEEPSDA